MQTCCRDCCSYDCCAGFCTPRLRPNISSEFGRRRHSSGQPVQTPPRQPLPVRHFQFVSHLPSPALNVDRQRRPVPLSPSFAMAGRSGSRSHEGAYSNSPPSSDPHDPFTNGQDPRYYDNDSDHEYNGRNRDTYGSDSSNNAADDDRYYDNGMSYDYGRELLFCTSLQTER